MVDKAAKITAVDLEMVRLGPEEAEQAIAILNEASTWLKTLGIDQWKPGPALNQTIQEAAERGDLWLAKLEGQPVGTLILQWQDPAFWGEQPDDAGYIHKLATKRNMAGRGVGNAMLEWAEQQIVAAGRPFARLDCAAENPPINAYYQAAGYLFKGLMTKDDWLCSLYEKQLEIVANSDTAPQPEG